MATGMRSEEACRPSSQFEALLAVSGNLLASSKAGAQSRHQETSCAEHSELDSADDTAMGGDYGEGVGESSGAESLDSGCASENCKEQRGKNSMGLKSEESDSRSGETATSWSARSQPGKKQRMIWTIELHKRFLNAINHLGMDNAVPKVILKMMNVDGMTRENVASHLQKYRLHLKRQSSGSTSTGPVDCEMTHLDPQHHSDTTSPPPTGFVKGIPIPPPAAAGVTALGLPLVDVKPLPPVSIPLVGASRQHIPRQAWTTKIPPQAWAAGVPGYDALQSLQRMSPQERALLYMNLSMRAQAPDPVSGPHVPPPAAMPPPKLNSVVLDIVPLTTTTSSRPPSPMST